MLKLLKLNSFDDFDDAHSARGVRVEFVAVGRGELLSTTGFRKYLLRSRAITKGL